MDRWAAKKHRHELKRARVRKAKRLGELGRERRLRRGRRNVRQLLKVV